MNHRQKASKSVILENWNCLTTAPIGLLKSSVSQAANGEHEFKKKILNS